MESNELITLDNIFVDYGSTRALDGVSLAIRNREIVSLLGPNGAGKSTLLKAIFGLLPIVSGKMLLHDLPFSPVSYEMPKNGFALVLQGKKVFSGLSTLENLEIGGFTLKSKDMVNEKIKEVLEIFPSLGRLMNIKAGFLSGGEQQMLALARSLIASPKVILLDEPSLGLSPKIAKEVFRKIKEINELNKVSFLIAEHNFKLLFSVSDRGYYLENGKVVMHGNLEQVIEKHLREKKSLT
ncbi:MAG TPA: ABC transporter ATP-binding protein [Patescibacteria group bacterium]|nr:ABC transporter ATP-binding protein [Patescibacteria group bacterium]